MRLHNACRVLAAILLLVLFYQGVSAHDGHEPNSSSTTIAVPAAPRAEAASDLFELVVVAGSGELTIYLDRFATNEPVPDATITVDTSHGSIEAKSAPDGTYRVSAPWSKIAGRHDLIVTVTKDGTSDVLTLTLEVPTVSTSGIRLPSFGLASGAAQYTIFFLLLIVAFAAGAFATNVAYVQRKIVSLIVFAASVGILLSARAWSHNDESNGAPVISQAKFNRDVAQLLADGSVFVPKSTQRILAIQTVLSELAAHPRIVELPGRIIPDPSASGYVQTSVGGRLSPPERGFPRLGTPVKKGDVLAYVTPPLQAIDVSNMRQQQGEIDQQISIVANRLARYEALAPSGAIAKSQLDDTRLELQGLRERRASLNKVQREPEALIAPVDGVVADGTPISGQIAQTNAVVFHIVNPERLWIEALSYEALPNIERATARFGDKELKLAFRGAGFSDRNQSIPIHFAIESDVTGVRVGQFVTVLAAIEDKQEGLAVPRTSIIRNSAGQDIVYEHVTAEGFEQRAVRIEPLDGQRVLILQGLMPGKRVVVQGAELIDHIR